MGRKRALTAKQVQAIADLRDMKGNVSEAALRGNFNKSSHYNWLKSSEKYRELYQEIVDRNVDLAESKLLANVNKGDQRAIEFTLKTQGKHRGYSLNGSQTEREFEFKDEKKNTVIDAINSYTEFNDVLLLLDMEQYQFIKFVDADKGFRSAMKTSLSNMLFDANNKASDNVENKKSLIIRNWLTVLNDGMSFSTSTMMYISMLMGNDSFTYDEQFWASPEGVKVLESLREYIIKEQDYLLFAHLYFKRVLRKQLRMMPYLEVVAKFYLKVFEGDRKRFICNLPVRHGKSEFVNALIFFMYLLDPAAVIMHGAYGETVLKPMRARIETALNSDPFFTQLMKLDTPAIRFNNTDFITTKGGNYLSFTIGGQITGRGGNALNPDEKGGLILDDINAPKWKGTQHMLNANLKITDTLLSRIPHLPLLNTQQRIGDDDLTSYLLEDSNANPPSEARYRYLILYIPFDKNETTDEYYAEMKRKYPNVDWFGYEEMPYGVINPSMAHYAVKETCPEAWHIYLTQYQQIPTESADKLFNNDMFIELRKDEIGVHATTGHLMYFDHQEDGKIHALNLTLLFHVDTSQLSDETDGSDYTVISVVGVGVDHVRGLKRAILFEQWQEQDININDFSAGFEGVATKWLSAFPKNDINLAVEQKSAGSVAKTTCEEIIVRLTRQFNVQSAVSLELDRKAGDSKRMRGEQTSQSLTKMKWYRYYPYDLGMAISTRFAQHGNIQVTDPDHWYHEKRYEMVNFTGRESSSIHDDCCEAIFDVSNKMILDGGEWREYVDYQIQVITEHNIVKG